MRSKSFIFKAIDDMPHDFNQCLWVSSLVIFLYGASMQALVMMSVDRLWAIYFPFSYHSRTRNSVTIVLALSWIPAVFDGGLPLFGWNRKDEFKGKCIVTLIMDTRKSILSSSYIFVSLIAMIIMYTMIYIAIVRQVIILTWFSVLPIIFYGIAEKITSKFFIC